MEQIEEKEIRPYDVIVIGAGAAGMMPQVRRRATASVCC